MTTKARDLQQHFLIGQAERSAKKRALEKERVGLVLAAHTGDSAALARLTAIKRDLAKLAEASADVERLIDDLQPRADQERRADGRVRRRERAAHLDRVMEAMVAAAEKADRAMLELVGAMAVAGALVEEARRVSVELIALPSHGDAAMRAINTMVAMDSSALRPLPELAAIRLASIGVVPSGAAGNYTPASAPLADMLRYAQSGLADRVRAVLQRDVEADHADAVALEAV